VTPCRDHGLFCCEDCRGPTNQYNASLRADEQALDRLCAALDVPRERRAAFASALEDYVSARIDQEHVDSGYHRDEED
jgi:hypothetical protein